MALLGQFRRDTLANWQSNNPVLADGEFALVATNSAQPKKYDYWVCGDGTTAFTGLTMASLASSVGITGITDVEGNSSSLAASQKLVTEKFTEVEHQFEHKVDDLSSSFFLSDINSIRKIPFAVSSEGKYSSYFQSYLIPALPGASLSVTANESIRTDLSFVKSYNNPSPGDSVDFCSGYTAKTSISSGQSASYTVPSDCLYIIVLATGDSNNYVPDKFVIDGYDLCLSVVKNYSFLVNEDKKLADDISALNERYGSIIYIRNGSGDVTIGTTPGTIISLPVSIKKGETIHLNVPEVGTLLSRYRLALNTTTNYWSENPSTENYSIVAPYDITTIYIRETQSNRVIGTGTVYCTVTVNRFNDYKDEADWQTAVGGGNLCLKNYLLKVANITEQDTQVIIGMFGDSWTQHTGGPISSDPSYARFVKKQLQQKYGNAGGGWYSFSESSDEQKMGCVDPDDANDTRADAQYFVYRDEVSGCYGVDAADVEFLANSWLVLNVLTAHNKFNILYLERPGGGVFSYQIDDETPVVVDTDAETLAVKSISLTTTDSEHTIRFEGVSGGSVVFGVDMQRTTNGVRVHKLANKGAMSEDFVNINATTFEQIVNFLNLDTAQLLFGVNDLNQGGGLVTVDNICDNLATIVGRIQVVNPYVDVVLLSPSNQDRTRSFKNLALAMYRKAVDLDCSSLSFFPLFGSYERIHNNGKNQFPDGTHPSVQSGRMMANFLLDKIYK